jgi:hypothetical protein
VQCTPLSDLLKQHYVNLIDAMISGRVVPFLGAGANLCGRPKGKVWKSASDPYLPTGSELSAYLAHKHNCAPGTDLARISQDVTLLSGTGGLFGSLHELFDRDYSPTSLHQLLAGFPSLLAAKGLPPRYQLIVTTNYDDVLERAFIAANEPFDLVTYVSEGKSRGKFIHTTPDGASKTIDIPNQYREVSLDRRSVILKIHGAVNRAVPDGVEDSYVITEDHYIDYLTRTDLSNLVPVTLLAKLRRSHFLFLGYGLRDWNLRVILHRIAEEQNVNYKSWAIQLGPSDLDRRAWSRRDVEILDLTLDRYVSVLRGRLNLLPKTETAASA